jgi:hypothetical protein
MVVARYTEDINWLHKVKMPVLVYDRYSERSWPWPTVSLPNHPFGREAHTYLYHVVHQYDHLADVTIFSQGNPFTHVDHFFKIIQEDFYDTTPLTHHRNWHAKPIPWKWKGYSLELGGKPYDQWSRPAWEEIFPFRKDKAPRRFVYGPGAIYAVPKRRIYEKGLPFFQRLLSAVEREDYGLDAWRMEMVWCYIFGRENFIPMA